MVASNRLLNWLLFLALCFIWGSSFILMKEGMVGLTPYQVAAIRMLSAGIILLPAAIRRAKQFPSNIGLIIVSGLLGSFFPAFLFCIAETKVGSALAGILNALTPICVIVVGNLVFHQKNSRNQVAGVLIGFVGLLVLLSNGKIDLNYISYALLLVLATLSYGFNVNMVNRKLLHIPSLNIAAFAFTSLILPSLVVLWFTDFFKLPLNSSVVQWSVAASALLGIGGTAVATILFYMLLKKAGPIFSSMVTYGIPFVAIFWGWLAGEAIAIEQIICLIVILAGVFVSRRPSSPKSVNGRESPQINENSSHRNLVEQTEQSTVLRK
jgi:drug/metabolite transporter (DMT)-like permease